MQVPFLDLKVQYATIRNDIARALQDVLDNTAFAGGPFVERFEEEFAEFCGTRYAVGVGSGTEALWLVLAALGVGRGDEVITVPNTFIATTEAISFCGATPRLVDVNDRYYTMDPDLLDRAITPRTKAIIPVHLYGQTADMDPILEIAGRHGIAVVEDACQAHGASYKGRPAGSMGIAGCFSFYPGKNLGAYGEAGGITTNDAALAAELRRLRDHGQDQKYYHGVIGWNGRMDGFQAAVLSVKLKHLNEWNEKRRQHAAQYRRLLAGMTDVILPVEAPYAGHVYHVYAIRTPQRETMMADLKTQGVGCAIHYPVPIHLQKAYAPMNLPAGSFPVAERCSREEVSLPMFAELTCDQLAATAAGMHAFSMPVFAPVQAVAAV